MAISRRTAVIAKTVLLVLVAIFVIAFGTILGQQSAANGASNQTDAPFNVTLQVDYGTNFSSSMPTLESSTAAPTSI